MQALWREMWLLLSPVTLSRHTTTTCRPRANGSYSAGYRVGSNNTDIYARLPRASSSIAGEGVNVALFGVRC